MNIAIILAGGVGLRFENDLPKQFLKVAGKMVIEHTLKVFQEHSLIDEIAVVTNPEYINEVERISNRNGFNKIKKILQGGQERYQSSLAAINAYEGDHNILFHDAVRPLVNDRIITDCLNALHKYKAIDVAIKATDTIIQVNPENHINAIPNRAYLRNGQTPQAFKLETIKLAYRLAQNDINFMTTDDCGVVHKYLPNETIYVVEGEVFNIKLTYKEDLFFLDKLFQLKSLISSKEILSDIVIAQLKEKVIVVFGGSSGIGFALANCCKENGAIVYSFSRSLNMVDVSDKGSVQKVLNDVYKREKKIDCVVNTAGVLMKEPLANMDYIDIMENINVNYIGSVIIAKESFPFLKETQGSLLLYTSSSYTRGRSMYSIYSSSKAAIVNLVQALSEEWDDFGIRINCINPERTKTNMRTRNFGLEPDNTLLNPDIVAITSINVLMSDMTGEVIDIKRQV